MVIIRDSGEEGYEHKWFICFKKEDKPQCHICTKTLDEGQIVYSCEICKETWHKRCDKEHKKCTHLVTSGDEFDQWCGRIHIE